MAMNLKSKIAVLMAVLTISTSCGEDYDDTALNNRVDNLENRVAQLEELCRQMNTNVTSLQALVQALENMDYVTGVTPVIKDGVQVGYAITFSKSGPITIYHGTDGADGYMPTIGVKKDTDGNHYWTLDNGWMLDADGNRMKVTGNDGKDGKDGLVPRLKVENGFWYVSYDEGMTWEKTGTAGSSTEGVFKDVSVTDEGLALTLADNTFFLIPHYKPVNIEIENSLQGIGAGAVVRIPYTLAGATDETVVSASSDGNYRVKLEGQTPEGGFVVVTAPDPYVDGYINVLVSDGAGHTQLSVISFFQWQMEVTGLGSSGHLTYSMPIKGGVVEIPLSVNFDYEVRIPEEAAGWVSAEVNGRGVMRDETLRLIVASNKTDAVRSCEVGIVPTNAEAPVFTIILQQSYQIKMGDGSAMSNLPGLGAGYQD